MEAIICRRICNFVHLLPPGNRSETNTSLREAREEQVHTKEHFCAVQAQRDREEFERVLGSVDALIINVCMYGRGGGMESWCE